MKVNWEKYKFVVLAICYVISIMFFGIGTADATCIAEGRVLCDVNGNGEIDDGVDLPLEGVRVVVENLDGTFSTDQFTGSNGDFYIWLQNIADSYVETLDALTLPDDATILINASGKNEWTTSYDPQIWYNYFEWLISSEICREGGGGEGCTPGYWRNHLDKWCADYNPGDDFDTIFGVDFFDEDKTLEQAVRLGGGGLKKCARHGTAAMLNACSGAVDYDFTASEIIDAVQACLTDRKAIDPMANANEASDTCPAELE